MSTSIIPHDRPHSHPKGPPSMTEQRAAALAHIQQMSNDLQSAHDEIGQLKADLNRADDRMVLLNDERARLRHEVKVYRNALIELATSMSNISLLTGKAVEIMQSANELLYRSEDAPADDPSATSETDKEGVSK
jgi:chromosome segregation ATPase